MESEYALYSIWSEKTGDDCCKKWLELTHEDRRGTHAEKGIRGFKKDTILFYLYLSLFYCDYSAAKCKCEEGFNESKSREAYK